MTSALIPTGCTVLVVGGGRGRSYTAAVLIREGIDTVLLETNEFPKGLERMASALREKAIHIWKHSKVNSSLNLPGSSLNLWVLLT